jgi:hypothetical protein
MLKITEHNCETNEIVEREMTSDEMQAWEQKEAAAAAEIAEKEAKAQAKAELLARLGISEAEAKLLLNS